MCAFGRCRPARESNPDVLSDRRRRVDELWPPHSAVRSYPVAGMYLLEVSDVDVCRIVYAAAQSLVETGRQGSTSAA